MMTLLETISATGDYSYLVLPVALLAIGLFLLIMEVTVIPGFGIAGVSGFLLVGAGVFLGVQEFTVRAFDVSPTSVTALGSATLAAVAVCSLSVMAVVKLLPRMPGAKKLFHEASLSHSEQDETRLSYLNSLVGHTGMARTDLRPAGKATIHGSEMDVMTDGSYVSAGEQIRIAEVREGHLVVQRLS